MVYRVIGLMSGSSLDGLDIVYTELQENGGKWTYDILHADCLPYSAEWAGKLRDATRLTALEYQLLHTGYGHFLGQEVNRFIEIHGLQFKVALVASHGHTTFHVPEKKMTAQLGDGAAIAATTQLPVVSDLRALDVAFGGQGAPIVPIGEKLLLGDYAYFLNIGGIANISFNKASSIAFDVCAANRVLNLLAAEAGKEYDDNGRMAAAGMINGELLAKLNAIDYYKQPFPKSLANEFGTGIVYPLIQQSNLAINDALRTYTEHIAEQIKNSIAGAQQAGAGERQQLLVTGGGAFNGFLIDRLEQHLAELNIDVIIPDEKLVKFKEALVMALIGVLRWREEANVLSTVTGAARNSVGGALWMGQES